MHQRPAETRPVLILGAGINGLCVARELAVNGVSVVVVDRGDIGCGSTAKSSRLIHGGLRYLEYGDFRLVRESLEERARLLALAPHFVRPMRLHIPLRRRSGGLLRAAVRFLAGVRAAGLLRWFDRLGLPTERGLWAVRVGLTLYDWLARNSTLPRHDVSRVTGAGAPAFDPRQFRFSCSYWDAQISAPERFCVALARDARQAARDHGQSCEVYTYHEARVTEEGVLLSPVLPTSRPAPARLDPAMIINATGAWGDRTLAALGLEAPRLFGGTRGSHIVTRQPRLRDALGEEAIYAEAPDGRLVFILPWRDQVLIGTTDVRFDGPPDQALATEDEISYLLEMVNLVLPHVQLTGADVESHYSGVRPLPFVPVGRTSAITRDHAIDTRTTASGLRIDTLIGGKLTTSRAFGEQVGDRVLEHLGRPRIATTRERVLPGCQNYPQTPQERAEGLEQLAGGQGGASAAALWELFGSDAPRVLEELRRSAGGGATPAVAGELPETALPLAVVDWIVAHEHVQTVADLVERRLLLVFTPHLTWETLAALEESIRRVRGECPSGAAEAAAALQRNYGVDVAARSGEAVGAG
jgi:glycerol-3-phosphate dehydrogenase